MTTVAVLVRPPEPGAVLSNCVEAGAVTAEEAATLYGAMARDVCTAVAGSGGDLLVNYRPVEADDETSGEPDESSLAAVESMLEDAFDYPENVRYEVQVGSSLSARVGNTVTHLLEREEVKSAAVVEPSAAMLERRHVDSAAMKLRQSDVVLGPATDGRVSYAAFCEPIDFADAYTQPAVETLTDRARDAGLSVDYLEMVPVAETPGGLATLISQVRARRRAEKPVPTHTATVIEDLGLRATAAEDSLWIGRD